MNASDLEKLGKQIAEAQALLSKKGEVEHEIAKARKQLDRLLEDVAKTEASLEAARTNLAASEARLDYEKKRHDADLKTHIDNVAALKTAAEHDLCEREAVLAEQRQRLETEYASAGQRLEREIAALADQRDHLQRIIGQAKSQLAALG